MPIMTYKEMVEDILNDMDSDPLFTVSGGEDITATEESRQVVQIIKSTYYNIIDGKDWPHLYQLIRFTETSGTTPTHLTIPTNTMDFKWIRYDVRESGETREKFKEITFMEPLDFIELVDARNNDDSNVDIITDTSGATLKIINDKPPQYWTSFDESSIIMDSYDSDVEAFLKTAKNRGWGKVYPTVTETDAFTFDLPVDAFSYFLNEAKSMCFLNIKQAANPKIEQQATTQRRRMSQEAWKRPNGINYPNYGRQGKK